MKYFFAIVAILALSACATTEQKPSQANDATVDAAHIKAQAAVQACKDKHAKGELKTLVDTALCSNPRIVAAYRQANYPYMDLVYLGVSAKLAGAVKADAGQITEAQLDGQVAELRTRVAAEEQRRRAAGETQAPAAGPPDTLLAGLSAFEAASSPGGAHAAPVIAIHAEPTLAADQPPPAADEPPPAERQALAMAPPAPLPAPPPAKPGASGYRLQFGVFAREDNATRLTKAINTAAMAVSIEPAQDRAGRTLYYVRSSTYPDLGKAQSAAKAAQVAAQNQGFKGPVSYVVLPVGDAH